MDLSDSLTATKQYNWRGEHVAYQLAGTTIPCDDRNKDYRAVLESIANGQCRAVEPDVTTATKVHSSAGVVTGYDTNLGFVPHDTSNSLYVLLQESARVGNCKIEEPGAVEENTPKIHTLIFCLVLDRGWQHLAGPLTHQFDYQPNERAKPIKIDVRIRNLPASAEDVLPHVFQSMGIEAPSHGSFRFKALQAGMIEIEVPVTLLLKLFRNERARVRDGIEPFFTDSLAQHHVRTGREESRGPEVSWLINMAPYYLTYAVADVANVALQAFALEYGGAVPGHVAEDALVRSSLVFARHAEGHISLHRLQQQGEQSFGLVGEWPVGPTLLRLADEQSRKTLDLFFVASRVRQLFGAGFPMEALIVANAAFEVALEWALSGAVVTHVRAQKLIADKGHSYRLELLTKVVAANTEAGLNTVEFSKFVAALMESNSMRNSYLHQLVVPTNDVWKLAQLDRTVERVLFFITDPHTSFITLGFLISLARTARSETVALLLTELQKLREWDD